MIGLNAGVSGGHSPACATQEGRLCDLKVPSGLTLSASLTGGMILPLIPRAQNSQVTELLFDSLLRAVPCQI